MPDRPVHLGLMPPNSPADLKRTLRELLEQLDSPGAGEQARANAVGILDIRSLVLRDYRVQQRATLQKVTSIFDMWLVPQFRDLPISSYPEVAEVYAEERLKIARPSTVRTE